VGESVGVVEVRDTVGVIEVMKKLKRKRKKLKILT
jgi:hypothetical protein